MGLLGKSFASKVKTITTVAVSRIAILGNQHKARASFARSDVAQLLKLGYHDRALLRVEQWIIEQNMLDVFVMIEIYCNFLRERAQVLEKINECPIELKEATSSLIFASSRCGEFPELHKIQEIFTSKFGKEFADHAVELHRNNGVNSKMIQKLSTRRPAMEIKTKALKQIAAEIGVTLYLEQDSTLMNVNKLNVELKPDEMKTRKWSGVDNPKHKENAQNDTENAIKNKSLSDRVAITKVDVHPMVSSSSKQKDEVIDVRELKGKEIQKQFGWEESRLSQSPRYDMKTSGNTVLVLNEQEEEVTYRKGNIVLELDSAKSFLMDNSDHSNQCDAATEDEHLREERTHPSSQAIRWNPQRSQADATANPTIKRPVMENTTRKHFPKQTPTHHDHVDWKVMSVRTR